MVIGENQRFMAALITFKVEVDLKTGLPTNKLLPEVVQYFKDNINKDIKTSEEASKSKEVF